jgi:hypothetical protein
MEDHKKVLSIQILIEVEVKVVKLHFKVDTKVRTVDIINMKVKLMKVDEETWRKRKSRKSWRSWWKSLRLITK